VIISQQSAENFDRNSSQISPLTMAMIAVPVDINGGYDTNSSSAISLVTMLNDEEPTLQVKALERISKVIDLFWAEVSEQLTLIEEV